MAAFTFEILYEAYSPMIYWTAYGVSSNHDTALEITQVVFMKAYEHWGVLEKLAMPQAKSWLYKVARNTGIDRLRKEQREVVVEELPERPSMDAATQPELAAIKAEQADALFALVQALPPIYREPVLLHYFAQLSQKEAAAVLNITGGTYRSRLSRAKAQLEQKINNTIGKEENSYEA